MAENESTTFAVALPDSTGIHCYLTTGEGDPPRCYTPEFANRYQTEATAKGAITRAKKRSPFKERKMIIVPILY